MPTSFTVGNETKLNSALSQIDKSTATNTAFTITLNSGLTGAHALELTTELDAINLGKGDTLKIVGNGDTIDGGGSQRGFFVYSGKVTIEDLTIENTKAVGGAGARGGGGGG